MHGAPSSWSDGGARVAALAAIQIERSRPRVCRADWSPAISTATAPTSCCNEPSLSSATSSTSKASSTTHLFSAHGLDATPAVRDPKVRELVEFLCGHAGEAELRSAGLLRPGRRCSPELKAGRPYCRRRPCFPDRTSAIRDLLLLSPDLKAGRPYCRCRPCLPDRTSAIRGLLLLLPPALLNFRSSQVAGGFVTPIVLALNYLLHCHMVERRRPQGSSASLYMCNGGLVYKMRLLRHKSYIFCFFIFIILVDLLMQCRANFTAD